jgi:hypothetical protein
VRRPLFHLGQATGYFPFQACRIDRRFSYGVYVPSTYSTETAAEFRILIAVHGTERAPEAARELFVNLADETRRIVLAPLFPMAVTDDEETHNYIFLEYRGIRYDQVLLAMVDEVAERFGVSSRALWLAGFSGGGQFAHRFMYLHASRLAAVSVGAPGLVNTLDERRDWFVGVRNVAERFGQGIDQVGLKCLPVQVVVGDNDVATDIVIEPPSPLYAEGVNDSGSTRVERARFLHQRLRHAGIDSRLDVVPGARHLADHVHLAVEAFFRNL